MNKNIFFLLFILILFMGFAYAQDPIDTSEFEDAADQILDSADAVEDFREEAKWEYLSEQWKQVILENEGIANLDRGLRNINPLIFFFFGEDYDISLTFLFAVMLWFIFMFILANIIKVFGTFSDSINWGIAFILAILFAHLKIYSIISLFIFKVIFYREGAWSWAGFIIFVIVYVFFILYSKKIFRKVKENIENRKEMEAKRQQELDREILHGTAGAIKEAYDETE